MTKIEFIKVLAFFLLIFLTSTLTGITLVDFFYRIFKKEKPESRSIEIIGASLLVGIGFIGYLALLVGIAGLFTKIALLGIITVCLLISMPQINSLFRSLRGIFLSLFKEYKSDLLALIALLLSLVTMTTLYLSSMQPPNAWDELAYHLPEVRSIVDSQKIDLAFGGHALYGNIPKLMEIIFAVGKTISSYQLSHALNFAILLGLIMVVFGFVRRYYGIKAASYSVLLLTWFHDLTGNSTSAYIDSATTAFELSSLLFILIWLNNPKEKINLYISSILIGIAASIKYSPFPTAAFILGVLIFKLFKDYKTRFSTALKTILPYFLVAFIFGGFWYVKNFVKFGNPFYPLYFGHKGYSDEQYKGLIEAIQQFGPKTPGHFFDLTKYFLTSTSFFIFISIYASPIILFINKKNIFRFSLFLYFLFYTIYWFLFATHQIRFWTTGLVISIVILAILTAKLQNKILISIGLTSFLIASLYFKSALPEGYKRVWNGFWSDKFNTVDRQYALGNVSETQFLTWKLGCQYSVMKYLEDNNLEGGVIDNWSVWFAPNVSFYAVHNSFHQLEITTDKVNPSLLTYLQKSQTKYLYFDADIKQTFLDSKDAAAIQSKDSKLPAENYILKRSQLIYKNESCYLYKIEY